MTPFDATVAAAQAGRIVPAGGIVRFGGDARRFWPLLAHGAILLICTPDIRRYLWSNSGLAGESFEYSICAG